MVRRGCDINLKMIRFSFFLIVWLPYGLAVRIPGFHPGGPGSTPGMGRMTLLLFPSSCCSPSMCSKNFSISFCRIKTLTRY